MQTYIYTVLNHAAPGSLAFVRYTTTCSSQNYVDETVHYVDISKQENTTTDQQSELLSTERSFGLQFYLQYMTT